MNITFNNQNKTLPEKTTLAELLQRENVVTKVIVEYNEDILSPQQDFQQIILKEGDVINLFRIVAGG